MVWQGQVPSIIKDSAPPRVKTAGSKACYAATLSGFVRFYRSTKAPISLEL